MLQNKPALRLLPNYWKKIAYLLMALTALAFVTIVIIRPTAAPATKEVLKLLLGSTFILAMAIIAASRDKVEDELTHLLRLKAMAIAFIATVAASVVYPFAYLALGDSLEQLSSHTIIFNMLVLYLVIFSSMKQSR